MLIIYLLHSCSILLIGLPVPSYTISNHPLITATRMILKLKSHVTPLLKTLEWLLITFRKLASLLLHRRPFMIWLPPRHPSPHSQAPISTLLPANPWLCPVLNALSFQAVLCLDHAFLCIRLDDSFWSFVSEPSCLLGDAFLGSTTWALCPASWASVMVFVTLYYSWWFLSDSPTKLRDPWRQRLWL